MFKLEVVYISIIIEALRLIKLSKLYVLSPEITEIQVNHCQLLINFSNCYATVHSSSRHR